MGFTSPQAVCYSLSDGAEGFVESLLATGGLLSLDDDLEDTLRLPRDCEHWWKSWRSVELELLDAEDLRIIQQDPGPLGERVEFVLPSITTQKVLSRRQVDSTALEYATEQHDILKRQRKEMEKQQQEPGNGGLAGSSLTVPAGSLPLHPLECSWECSELDSPEYLRQRWKELRGNDEEEVRAALVGMLKLACAYRGRVALQPTGGGGAPQAAQAAAAGAGPGAPAGGA